MLTLVLGGAASGKSEYAESLVLRTTGPRYYLATMQVWDAECAARVEKHRKMRAAKQFETLECPLHLETVRLPRRGTALLEDLGNLTANELYDPAGAGENAAKAILHGLESLAAQCENLIVVSNEVFSAVIFLAFSGVYWLYSFAVKPRRLLQRLLAVGACVSAIACITAIAFAYSADTVITWNTPFSPFSLWANALLGGPVLAIVGLRAAWWKSRGNRFGRFMLVLAVVALAACLVAYALQGAIVLPAENAVSSAGDLVPHYALLVCFFAVFAAVGIAVDALSLFRTSVSREGKASPDEMTISVVRASVAALLVLAGIFVMRVSF